MLSIDRSLFFALHNYAGHTKIVDSLIIFFSEYLIYFVFAIFIFSAFKSYRKNADYIKLYAMAIFSSAIAYGVGLLIRLAYHRPRPFLEFSLPHLINNSTYSFPSGHTIILAGLGTAVYFFNKKLALFIYISGIMIGLARIAGGVHYPSDILGAFALGAGISMTIYFLVKRYRGSWISIENNN